MQTAARAKLLSAITENPSAGFEELAMEVLRYQATNNPLYARFLELLKRQPGAIADIRHIPFLPISFFKSHQVQAGEWPAETTFSSSGTTGQTPSRHLVCDVSWYLSTARKGFQHFYGHPAEWRTLALLPSYLERSGSSLVAMADDFIRQSRYPDSGFFLADTDRLAAVLQQRKAGEKTLLLGVSFALLDLAERHPMDLHDVVIMETGGMKGRRKEITREELHTVLKNAFHCPAIHSEYGMTELFSQAYSPGGGIFTPAPTLRVFAFEINDPFAPMPPGRNGQLCFIDLANLDTCAFIATEDIGKVHPDGRFEVLGRMDTAEMRGCNLMVE
jgi:hypothetical protein